MDYFLTYIANDTKQNANDILDKMVPDNSSFEGLQNISNEPGMANISVSSNGTIKTETGTSNSDVVMETTASGTSSEKEGVTYPESSMARYINENQSFLVYILLRCKFCNDKC